MSGGHYNYKYQILNDLADEIEADLNSGEIYNNCNDNRDKAWIKAEVINLIKDLREDAKRAYELEWYMSGDTGIESYRERIRALDENFTIDDSPCYL
jgi:hypothetical protein